MAFNAAYLSGPLSLGGLAQGKVYIYDSADPLATVIGAGFFAEMGAGASPATSRGMEKGDIVIVRLYDSVTTKATFYGSKYLEVASVDSDGDVTVQPAEGAPVAVTATADGLTTGLIPSGAGVATITSANAAHIVTLPVPVPGQIVFGFNGATACEIRTLTGVSINAVAFPNELLLAANSWFIAVGLSATAWVIKTITLAGVVSATDVPDA
jgi:hypothetical protein